MTASGNQEAIQKAISQIKTAIIGVVIVLAAWAITHFIILSLSAAVSNKVNIFP